MTDDPRALLASLPHASMIPTPAGYVAILRELVPEDDRDAVDAWVAANGGARRRTPPTRYTGLRPGRTQARTLPGEAYYVIPAAALRG